MEKQLLNLEIEEVTQFINDPATVRPGGDSSDSGNSSDSCSAAREACDAQEAKNIALGCAGGAIAGASGGWMGSALGCVGGAFANGNSTSCDMSSCNGPCSACG
jgi:hypothetical protein